MAVGHKSKAKSPLTEEICDFLKRRELKAAYGHLLKEGGLKKLVNAEKGVYKDHLRKHDYAERVAKAVLKGEGKIRGQIADQEFITIGTRKICVFAEEVSTKAKKSKDAPGGSIDLLGYDVDSGRVIVIELKDEPSKETLLEALLQVSVYRAQLALIKERVLKRKDCPDALRMKSRWAYGVVVLAPGGWSAFESELDLATKLLSREKKADAVFCVGELYVDKDRYNERERTKVKMLIGPKAWGKQSH